MTRSEKGWASTFSIRRSILWRTGSLIRCGAARRVGQRNNLLPEAPHPGLRPAMAPHRQATAALSVAVAGIGVERGPPRLLLRRITKPFGNDGPENILVAQVVAHRTKPLDLVAVFFARGPKTLHAAKRKTSVSDLPVERLPDHPARPLCTAKPPRRYCFRIGRSYTLRRTQGAATQSYPLRHQSASSSRKIQASVWQIRRYS